MNIIFHDRLNYGHQGIENYGIHLFGQQIEWIGNGGLGFVKQELEGAYNYVDCSYMKILLDYGLLVLLFAVIGYTLAVYQACRKNNIYLCLALSMVAVYSLIEPRLLEFGFNPFVLCLCSYMRVLNIPGDVKNKIPLPGRRRVKNKVPRSEYCNVKSNILASKTFL
ncbi:MAG: hypothetical protein LUF92_14075 [Clostridiales bacterium]|nr:hypothetical protein [Clostridiales bacterium]